MFTRSYRPCPIIFLSQNGAVVLSKMEQVTQANAASAEESAAASEELNAQAMQMQVMVSELVSLVEGSSRSNSSGQTSHRVAGTTARQTQALSSTDHSFHKIATGTKSASQKKQAVEQHIPLGESEGEFKEF